MQAAAQMTPSLDLDCLLKLRLVVARVGELGLAGWWGTKDVLGGMGAMAYRRGFPRSHHWAQAKVVFEVARARCQERFPDPTAITLWSLPAPLEEQFEHAWGRWIGENETWIPFFDRLKEWKSPSQFFPLYLYDESTEATQPGLFDEEPSQPTRRDAITDEGLAHFQEAYPDEKLTKEDLFYYVYGLLVIA